jgi:hypothetical protein
MRTVGTEDGNFSAGVVAPLDQGIVAGRSFPVHSVGLGWMASNASIIVLKHGELSKQPIEFRGPIHECSPEWKKAQRGGWAFAKRGDTLERSLLPRLHEYHV